MVEQNIDHQNVETSNDEPKFLFSIIMAIYNVEEYLEEAIESVINQTLNFEKHVQLILVNDGSPDNSEKICLKYQKKYPSNVVYLTKPNGGQASARNMGLKYVEGKYVNFLDPDDKLSSNTLVEVYEFLEKNYSDIDFVAIPLFFFEAQSGGHMLNYKFNKTRIIDTREEYRCIQLSISSTFIKSEIFNKHKFNEELKISAEDADLLCRILLKNPKYGVISTSKYYYRKRKSNSSSTQIGLQKKEWYTAYLKEFSIPILEYSLNKMGFVPKYIQYLVMHDIQWRLNISTVEDIMTKQEIAEFHERLKYLLKYIDDHIILELKNLNIHRKLYVLSLKNNVSRDKLLQKVYKNDTILLYYKGFLMNTLNDLSLTIDFLEIKQNKIYIEGILGGLFNKSDTKVYVKIDDDYYDTISVDRSAQGIYSLDVLVKDYYGFKVELTLTKSLHSIQFFVEVDGIKVNVPISKFRKYAKLNTEWESSYYARKNYMITYKDNQLRVERNRLTKRIKKEIILCKTFKKSLRFVAFKVFIARVISIMIKTLMPNLKIWLFLDRIDKADDNAEHLFKFSLEKKDGIKKYYIIKKDCKDYERIRKTGKVVAYGSYKHKMLYLLADKVISSHADDWVINPFFGMRKYYNDLLQFDFVFLQHGITMADLSNWLIKYSKNIKLFITAAKKEYSSILEGKYGYDKNVVKLTGFPRYDGLENRDSKQILIMPTWRRDIVAELDPISGIRPYNPMFKETEYYHLINMMINDNRLINKAKERGYKILFFPHPNIQQQIKDFNKHPDVEFIDYATSYQDLINESSLLVTDYSSVFYDFAYLKKPIVYFQFDNHHLKKGYFDFESMGFGEVHKDYQSVIEKIEQYIENNCEMEKFYKDRVGSFYAYTDRNNNQRVYDEIINMDRETIRNSK